ncbi:MAG TPA: hypothetical protein VFM71_03790 [Gemmatimonadaceae bacterium]|nr:hypothetical protein [Gemmatimonadaceae bacterium]
MWTILKSLLIQGVLARTALRSFGWLAWLLPLGFLLKWVGLPLLAVLSVLALPVLVLLVAIGLPLFVVFLFGSMLMAVVGTLLTVGIALAKVLIPVLIVVWLVRWLWGTRKPAPDVVTPSAS